MKKTTKGNVTWYYTSTYDDLALPPSRQCDCRERVEKVIDRIMEEYPDSPETTEIIRWLNDCFDDDLFKKMGEVFKP